VIIAATAASPLSGGIRGWLERAPAPVFATYAGLMAFGTYFAMYAFRKPFAVASFSGVAPVGVDYKIALVMAQVVGYALSKWLGVKVISELPAHRRIVGILLQICLAEGALILFALIPPPWNVACLFLDGLALGMVWGMVFAFVEGRRQSELIGAMLCASFILSSGVVKSVGEAVMLHGIAGPFWMPAVTGAIFAPLLVLCLAGLAVLPPPDAADQVARTPRAPMDKAARARLWRRFAPGLIALIAVYVLLTALRDFRDNFAAEIWADVGHGGQADIFAWSELPISAVVLMAMASLTLLRDNRSALTANFMLMGSGLLIIGLASALFALGWLGPVAWMIAVGGGLYLAYTPYNGLLFDRLVAVNGSTGGGLGNAGFLIYVADSCGYAGSVALLLVRNVAGLKLPWARFLIDASIATSLIGLALFAWGAFYFRRQIGAAPAMPLPLAT
jgi:hypothetical protein